uniref:Uncharacterized protein n=2 Tax=Sus scrofa TaxID=9823 RepID=A0A8D1W660_PIG
MPHFLDWFVPVYLFISVLILVGFGACIYYFEPGLQEAHKWRMQRPLVDRDFRKTLMVRDNLAFGGPELPTPANGSGPAASCGGLQSRPQQGVLFGGMSAWPNPAPHSGSRLGTDECMWWGMQGARP